MRTRPTNVLLASLLALGLAACSKKDEPPAPPPEPAAEPAPEAEPEAAPDPEDVHIEGDRLTIDRMIHFALDSDEILDDSTELLDHIAQVLKNHEELVKLDIVGHTDESGDHDHNQDLSERRAAAVVKALADRGVSQEMGSRGLGETEPLCEEDTDDCHEKNRRVEFIIVAE